MAVCKKVSVNDSKAFHRGLKQWIKPAPEPETEPSISKLFVNWGEVVRRGINDYLNQHNTKEGNEYTIICPRCNKQINIPSKHEFFNNGGNTRCPSCGLEMCMHTRIPLYSSKKEEELCQPENTEK